MAATPFKGIVTFKGKSGANYSLPISCSDVADAFATWSKSNQTFYTAPELVWLTDISLTAAGVDTNNLDLFVNGADVNIRYNDTGIKNTVQMPRLPAAIPISPGAMIQFKQTA